MFVDSLIVFVIVAERILRPISLSESLDMEPAQLEDRGQESQSLRWGLPIQPGPGKDRVQPLPPGKPSGLWVSTSFVLFLLGVCGPEG